MKVALTFDDGPSQWTEPILDILDAAGARATFFVLGENVKGREQIVRRTAAAGHEIGNHTFTHPWLQGRPRDEIGRELTAAEELIERVVLQRPRVFRAPYLATDEAVLEVARELGYGEPVAGALFEDWNRGDGEGIARDILAAVDRGEQLLVLHDGRPPRESTSRPDREPTVEAVRSLVPELLARGAELVTVSEL